MLEGIWVEVVIILALVLANGFFAASEIAIVSARKGRLEQRAASGDRGASAALDLAENPNRFLSTVQVGITLISTLAAAVGGANIANVLEDSLRQIPILQPYASSIALGSVVIAISYFSLILGELVPKRLALQNAEGVATFVSPIMHRLSSLVAPVISFLSFSTELVLRLLGRHGVTETPVTEDDVMALVREGTAEGTLEEEEKNLIGSVFSLTERTVRSLMTPRTQVMAVDIDTPLGEIIQIVAEEGYSRLPVYEGTLDHIIGILYIKDLLQAWNHPDTINIRSLLRPAPYLLESQRAVTAFQQLKQGRSVLAMVLDEYGQVAGVISMEDIIEELVGNIEDEYDEAKEAIVRRDDGSYLVDGLTPFVDIQAALRLPSIADVAHEGDFETIAGFVLTLLGRIPNEGDTVKWQGYTFEVIDMDARRIDKILLRPPLETSEQTQGVLASGAALRPIESDTGTQK